MFGAGGLFATQVLDIHGAQAAIIGVVAGIGGAALAGALFGVLNRSESGEPFKIADLVGDEVYVSVADARGPLRDGPRQEGGHDPRVRGDRRRGHPRRSDGASRRDRGNRADGAGRARGRRRADDASEER